MRMVPSGRGMPPAIDDDCLHMWTFDEASGNARDIFANQNGNGLRDLTDINTVGSSTESCVGPRGRYFTAANSECFNFGDANVGDYDVIAMSGGIEVAVVTCFELETAPVSPMTILDFIGDDAIGSAFRITITPSLTVKVEWYDALSVARSCESTFTVPVDRTVPMIIRRDPGGGGVVHDLFLYGEKVERMAGDEQAPYYNDGQPMEWNVGATHSGGVYSDFFNGRIDFLAVFPEDLFHRDDDWCEAQLRRMRRIGCPDATHTRIKVEDGGGDMREMTNLLGHNWVLSWVVRDGVDQATPTATVVFTREIGEMSLAKYHDNRMNRVPITATGPAGQAAHDDDTEMLDPGRNLTIEIAQLPAGLTPVARDYQLIFDGEQDTADPGDSEIGTVTVECRGRNCQLQNRRVQEIETYPEQDLETTMQDILDDTFGGGTWPLYVPVPTGATLREWTQERCSVQDALTKLAEIPALSLGWVFDEATQAFRLTLYEPDRTYSITKAMVTLDVNHYAKLRGLKIDRANIRNDMVVSYDSYEDPAPSSWTYAGGGGGLGSDGKPTRGYIRVDSDDLGESDSITRFGRQEMEKAEKGADGITTKAEAERQGVGMLRDLQDPIAEASLEFGRFSHCALGTVTKIYAPRPLSTADQRLAATGYEHRGDSTGVFTTLMLRGRPCGAITRHLESEARPGGPPPPPRNGWELLNNFTVRERLAAHGFQITARNALRSGPSIGPPNHDFNQHRISRQRPPDGWTMTAGTWGTHATVSKTSANVKTGQQSLQMDSSSAVLTSAPDSTQDDFDGIDGNVYAFSAVAKASANTAITVKVEWYDVDDVIISTTTVVNAETIGTSWQTVSGIGVAPSGARFYRIRLERGSGATNLWVDRVQKSSEGLSFSAVLTGGNYTLATGSNDRVDFDDDSSGRDQLCFDESGVYDASTNFDFTAPANGWYSFFARVRRSETSFGSPAVHNAVVKLRKNGATFATGATASQDLNVGEVVATVSSTIYLAAGDTVDVVVSTTTFTANSILNGTYTGYNPNTYFQGTAVAGPKKLGP